MHKIITLKLAYIPLLLILMGVISSSVFSQQKPSGIVTKTVHEKGRAVYDYYCYQCHGYAGDANTLASTFLQPMPRNFTTSDPENLDRDQMITALQKGRRDTAMVSFSSVLDTNEINSVVDYIRTEFMSGKKSKLRYHTAKNGWGNHERYTAAFPFANGELPLDTDWNKLTKNQREGKKLFMTACISCHDRAKVQNEGNIWDLRPLSYPRRHYTHTQPFDSMSGASPYAVHDKIPSTDGLSKIAKQGESLFQKNCAFCHGADGTGRNWIGRFLEPHARDLTAHEILQRDNTALRKVVLEGLPGTSMPAWKHLLSETEVDAIFEYLRHIYMFPTTNQAKQISIQQTAEP